MDRIPAPVLVSEPEPLSAVKLPRVIVRSVVTSKVGEPAVPRTRPMLPPVPVTPLMVRSVSAFKVLIVPPLKFMRRVEVVANSPPPAVIEPALSVPAFRVYCELKTGKTVPVVLVVSPKVSVETFTVPPP